LALAAAALALALVACTSHATRAVEHPTTTTAPNLANGTALDSVFKSGTMLFSGSVVAGYTVLYSPENWDVREDVQWVDAEPATLNDAMQLLDTRLTLLRDETGKLHAHDDPGGGCIPTWPPKGFGTTTPAKGTVLKAGQRVTVTFYLRTVKPVGNVPLKGVRVTYRQLSTGRLEQQTFTHSLDSQWLIVANAKDQPPMGAPNQPTPCFPPPPQWLQ
jgi:hypothetical protein